MLLQMRVTADGQFVPAAVETPGSALDKIIAPPPQALPGGTLRREFNRLVSERRWARAGQIPRGTFQSNYESSRAISQSNLFILASILKRHLIDRRTARQTRRYNRPEHTEIDACGRGGGSCATSFLLWEGTRRVGGCRCWGSMSEAVIVPIVKVLRQ